MKILITGGAGYFGSVLAHQLLSKGHHVRSLDSLMHGGEALLGLFPMSGFEFVAGDMRDEAIRAKALTGIDAVVHLAAIVGDPACQREPDLALAVNREATSGLWEQARTNGVSRFVFASTCSNYGKMADPDRLLDETSELRPVSLYAETKVEVEDMLLSAPADGPTATVLRISTLYGLSPRMRFDLTVNEFSMELMTARELTVYGEQFWRPYVHVRDACRAVCLVLESDRAKVEAQVFNVGDSRENYTKGDLVERIVAHVPHPVDIERVKKDEDPRDYRVCFDKIRDVLGFRITRTVPDGIAEVCAAVGSGVIQDVRAGRYRNTN